MAFIKDRNENEVDFTIVENEKVTGLYQICYDLSDEETQKKEIKSLARASKFFDCRNFDFGNNIKVISAEELFK
jgi:predicted AAA+ superfamily ATPase